MDGETQTPESDRLLEFVERFALVMTHSGMPRMPARVFAYVLADDPSEYTAAELASGLRVSNAAISGAVRYLVDAGLLNKGRKPGSRADHYYLKDDELWASIITQRTDVIRSYQAIAQEGIDTLGPEARGGRRMWETKEFFKFIDAEQSRMLERWHVHWTALKVRNHSSPLPPPEGTVALPGFLARLAGTDYLWSCDRRLSTHFSGTMPRLNNRSLPASLYSTVDASYAFFAHRGSR